MDLLELGAAFVGRIGRNHRSGAARHRQDVAAQPLEAAEVLPESAIGVRQGQATGDQTDDEYPFLGAGVHQLRKRIFPEQRAKPEEGRDNHKV